MLDVAKINDTVDNGALKPKQRSAKLTMASVRQFFAHIGRAIYFVLVVAVLYQGWLLRNENYITAESGIGYALGIIGGVMMLILLIYPMRKRLVSMKGWGNVKHWFRIHMLMGLLGPSAILFHANFQLGALNSNIALWCMVIVASSGLLGRYFYAKIHKGLYGRQTTLQELQQDSVWSMDKLTDDLTYLEQLKTDMQAYEKKAIKAGSGVFSIVMVPWLAISSRFAYARIWRLCEKSINEQVPDPMVRDEQLWKTRSSLQYFFSTVRKVSEFGFYQRLFSLWHILHMPLFVMMFITAIIHIIAVHMY